MSLPILLLIFMVVAGALFAVGAAVFTQKAGVGERLNVALGTEVEVKPSGVQTRDILDRILSPIGKMLPQSEEGMSTNRLLLTQAGFRESVHVQIYYGLRIAFAALLLVVAFVTGLFAKSLIAAIGLPVLGFMGTQFVLKRMVKGRQDRIRLGLPDALDLSLICVEAGLGLDQALDRVGLELRAAHPDLSDEFSLLTLEMRAGKSRADALRNLGTRTGVDDIRAFVAVLVQTDRFGTSIGTALRVHSDALRVERRQRAEERAAKTTIKMIPALVIFIFPVMFFVILGPVVITLMHEFQ